MTLNWEQSCEVMLEKTLRCNLQILLILKILKNLREYFVDEPQPFKRKEGTENMA